MLIILSGLPGVGKTTIAHALALELGAVHIRIDTIEHALRESGKLIGPMDDAGYRVGYAMAEGNLRLGLTVIADCVNPLGITREAWRDVAARARVPAVEIEVTCSDMTEHRRRIETRVADLVGFKLPTWAEVVGRVYEAWNGDRLTIDTAVEPVGESVARIQSAVADLGTNPRDT